MGPDALVTDELANGRTLIERLIHDGFDIHLAFWVKETEARQWFLYLSSPMVDNQGAGVAYRFILPIVVSMPELGIDLESIKLVGLKDSMTTAARKVLRPTPGLTRYSGSSLNGIDIDGAVLYPPFQPAAPA